MKPAVSEMRKHLRYDPETGYLWWRIFSGGRSHTRPAGSKDAYGYIRLSFKGKQYKAHRIAWLLMKGYWPKKEIDHRDTIKDNNRWSNLRLATISQNKRNRAVFRNTTSGIKGAQYSTKDRHWQARIRVGSKQLYLGCFKTPEEAAAVYAEAARKYHGAFARTS